MSQPHTIAVTGATGLLGRPLCRLLGAHSSYRLRAAGFSRAGDGVDKVDITDHHSVDAWLDDVGPSVLVHLAAERHPDVFVNEMARAMSLNVDSTAYLARACAARGTVLIFLSTNYVFDGKSSPYSPNDLPNPINDYGVSKYQGEQKVLAASQLHKVLRVPMLYGPSKSLDESPVTVIAKSLLNTQGPLMLDVRQPRFPAYTPDVAAAIVGIIDAVLGGGLNARILHFCPRESFTKRDIGAILAPMLGVNPAFVIPDTRPTSGAARPENVRMLCPGLEALGLLRTSLFQEALRRTIDSNLSDGVA